MKPALMMAENQVELLQESVRRFSAIVDSEKPKYSWTMQVLVPILCLIFGVVFGFLALFSFKILLR